MKIVGKANDELIRFLAGHFKVSRVEIISGHTVLVRWANYLVKIS